MIAFLEFWNESTGTHYMRGGKIGAFPALSGPDSPLPHPVPFNLYDPFGLSAKKSEEAKARGLKIEINNGRCVGQDEQRAHAALATTLHLLVPILT